MTLGPSAVGLGLGIVETAQWGPSPESITLSAIATGGLAVASAVVGLGVRRRAQHRAYFDAGHGLRRPQAHGLLAGGSIMMIDNELFSSDGAPVPALAATGLGAFATIGGAFLLGVGANRNIRWHDSERLRLQPSFGADRTGASLGLRGQF